MAEDTRNRGREAGGGRGRSQDGDRAWPGLVALGLILAVAPPVAAQTALTFDNFGSVDPNSSWIVDFQRKIARPDLAGTGGQPYWVEWCFRVTALSTTTCCPGEFTHFGIALPDTAPFDDPALQATIEGEMRVTIDDADYTKAYKASGGPLNTLGRRVEWNNVGDHLLILGEAADFCFAIPEDMPLDSFPMALKVGGVRDYQTMGPGVPALPLGGLALLVALLLGGGAWAARRRRRGA